MKEFSIWLLQRIDGIEKEISTTRREQRISQPQSNFHDASISLPMKLLSRYRSESIQPVDISSTLPMVVREFNPETFSRDLKEIQDNIWVLYQKDPIACGILIENMALKLPLPTKKTFWDEVKEPDSCLESLSRLFEWAVTICKLHWSCYEMQSLITLIFTADIHMLALIADAKYHDNSLPGSFKIPPLKDYGVWIDPADHDHTLIDADPLILERREELISYFRRIRGPILFDDIIGSLPSGSVEYNFWEFVVRQNQEYRAVYKSEQFKSPEAYILHYRRYYHKKEKKLESEIDEIIDYIGFFSEYSPETFRDAVFGNTSYDVVVVHSTGKTKSTFCKEGKGNSRTLNIYMQQAFIDKVDLIPSRRSLSTEESPLVDFCKHYADIKNIRYCLSPVTLMACRFVLDYGQGEDSIFFRDGLSHIILLKRQQHLARIMSSGMHHNPPVESRSPLSTKIEGFSREIRVHSLRQRGSTKRINFKPLSYRGMEILDCEPNTATHGKFATTIYNPPYFSYPSAVLGILGRAFQENISRPEDVAARYIALREAGKDPGPLYLRPVDLTRPLDAIEFARQHVETLSKGNPYSVVALHNNLMQALIIYNGSDIRLAPHSPLCDEINSQVFWEQLDRLVQTTMQFYFERSAASTENIIACCEMIHLLLSIIELLPPNDSHREVMTEKATSYIKSMLISDKLNSLQRSIVQLIFCLSFKLKQGELSEDETFDLYHAWLSFLQNYDFKKKHIYDGMITELRRLIYSLCHHSASILNLKLRRGRTEELCISMLKGLDVDLDGFGHWIGEFPNFSTCHKTEALKYNKVNLLTGLVSSNEGEIVPVNKEPIWTGGAWYKALFGDRSHKYQANGPILGFDDSACWGNCRVLPPMSSSYIDRYDIKDRLQVKFEGIWYQLITDYEGVDNIMTLNIPVSLKREHLHWLYINGDIRRLLITDLKKNIVAYIEKDKILRAPNGNSIVSNG